MAEKKSNDSIGKTLLVVLVLCLVCSIVVAGSAVGLKSRQQAQRALDKQRRSCSVRADAPRYGCGCGSGHLRGAHYPATGESGHRRTAGEDQGKFNQAQALKDPQQSMALDASQDPAGIKRRSNLAEIYLVRDAQQKIEQVVLPIYGNGLWSMMYAFVALDVDGRTVKGITYYDQGETPGWAARWKTRTGASSLSASRCWMTTACRR